MALVLLVGPACANGDSAKQASSTPSDVTSPTGAATPTAAPTSAPTTAATATPPAAEGPAVSCSAQPTAASEPLLLAVAPGNQTTLLESLADPTHPMTLCTLGGTDFRLISPIEVGYRTTSSSNDPIRGTSVIGTINLIDLKPVVWVSVQGDVLDYTWSPQGGFAYLLYTEDATTGAANQLWLGTGRTQPRPITPPIPLFGRDGSVDDQTIVRFSYDGKYLLMVDTFVAGAAPASPDQAIVQVHSVPDGALVWVPPSALQASGGKSGPYVTMAAWTHQTDRLYYRDQAGVHTWDAQGTLGTAAAGVIWYSPSVSPDDRLVAYDLVVNGQPHIEVWNVATHAIQVLPGERGTPILLSDDEMIESHYGPNTQGPGPPYLGTGWFALNLTTNIETPLPGFESPIDIWVG